jgi:hypothetical protein
MLQICHSGLRRYFHHLTGILRLPDAEDVGKRWKTARRGADARGRPQAFALSAKRFLSFISLGGIVARQ